MSKPIDLPYSVVVAAAHLFENFTFTPNGSLIYPTFPSNISQFANCSYQLPTGTSHNNDSERTPFTWPCPNTSQQPGKPTQKIGK